MGIVPSRTRLLNWLTIAFLVAALACSALLLASAWFSFAWRTQRQWATWGLEGGHGSIRFLYRPQFPANPGLEFTREPFAFHWRPHGLYLHGDFLIYAHGRHMHYGWNEEWEEFFIWPLPLAALALAASCRWLSRRAATRIAKGICPACAYDLNGIAPGKPCPECGQQSTPASAPIAG